MKEESELKKEFQKIMKQHYFLKSDPELPYDNILSCMEDAYNLDRPTPPVQAKTAEEILNSIVNNNPKEGGFGVYEIKMDKEDAISAIKAYHAQFTPSAKSVGLNLGKLQKDVDNFIASSTKESYEEAFKEIDKSVEVEDLQSRVLDWLIKCFGIEISKDVIERSDRFLEESLELAQSLNYTPDRAHALVDYVFSRDKGEPFQECGGVMVTLAALCSATGLNMAMDGEMEFARINKPEIIEKIRKKQASKPTGSALPQVWQQQKQAETISQLTESLKTIYSLAKPGSAIYDICDKTLNPPQTDR